MREVDSDCPIVGKVYHPFFALEEHISGMQSLAKAKREAILPMIRKRWNEATSLMHLAGYALDPEIVTHDYTSNDEVIPVSSCSE